VTDVWQVIENVIGPEIGKSRTMQNAG
jgi:hypothetical protein